MKLFLTVSIFLIGVVCKAQTTSPDFEIVGIGIISDACVGEWDEKADCSETLVNRYLLSNIDWASMDTVPKGKQRIELKFDVDDNGRLSNLVVESENISFGKSFQKVVNSWPEEFKYKREDGMKIVGRYSSFFSFYF
ncbi:MAG: hypothetical protein HKP14_07175 [Bacteroidia bacterium]|nr:hypothetical protein [Bacteroidia bacterium]